MFFYDVDFQGGRAAVYFTATTFVLDLSLIDASCEDGNAKKSVQFLFHNSIDGSIGNFLMIFEDMMSQFLVDLISGVTSSAHKNSSRNVLFVPL